MSALQLQRSYAEQQQQFKVLHRDKYLPLKETAALLNIQLRQALQVCDALFEVNELAEDLFVAFNTSMSQSIQLLPLLHRPSRFEALSSS